jgi:DNA-directed RNA polymerase delta subunit
MDVGLMNEEGKSEVVELTEAFMIRLIKNMPLTEFKNEVKKLSQIQIDELANYAIIHYTDLQMDRIDILSKMARKDMMTAIKNHKMAQEG